jgi:hypothetical protein
MWRAKGIQQNIQPVPGERSMARQADLQRQRWLPDFSN